MSLHTFTTSLTSGLVRAGLKCQEWEDEQPMLGAGRRLCSIYYYCAAMSKSVHKPAFFTHRFRSPRVKGSITIMIRWYYVCAFVLF